MCFVIISSSISENNIQKLSHREDLNGGSHIFIVFNGKQLYLQMGSQVGRYIAICLWVLSMGTEILDNRDQSTDYLPSAQSESSIGITLCMSQKRVLIRKKKSRHKTTGKRIVMKDLYLCGHPKQLRICLLLGHWWASPSGHWWTPVPCKPVCPRESELCH